MKTQTKKFVATLMLSTAMLGLGGASVTGFALGDGSVATSSESVTRLTEDVYNDVSGNTYRNTTGDGIKGSALFTRDGEVTDKFEQLTEADKVKLLQDIDAAAQDSQADDTEAINSGSQITNAVTDGTVSKFWEDLKESRNSVAAYMISVATADLAPDFQGASDFLAPITPFFNTGMGVFLILASLSFFLFLALDIFYFMAPPFQYYVNSANGEKGFKGFVGGMVTFYAKKALEEAMQEGGNPLVKYIGKAWLMLFAYALVLLFFASNATLTLVGPLANLFAGILGF